MRNRANYTIVGIFVLLSFLLMVLVVFWLNATSSSKSYNSYVVYVNESVTGLTENSTVRFNGVPVGFVEKITLDPNNPLLVELRLKVDSKAPVTTNTYASLHMWGITGSLELSLNATTNDGSKLQPTASNPVPTIPFRASLFVQISSVIPTISKNLLEMTNKVNALLSPENRKSVSNSLDNIQHFTESLNATSDVLNKSVKNLNQTLAATSNATKELPSSMKHLNKLLASATKTSKDLQHASKAIEATAKGGGVVMQNVSQQMLPSIQQSILQLNLVMKNIRRLTAKLNRNPSVLVRGQQPKQLGPGE